MKHLTDYLQKRSLFPSDLSELHPCQYCTYGNRLKCLCNPKLTAFKNLSMEECVAFHTLAYFEYCSFHSTSHAYNVLSLSLCLCLGRYLVRWPSFKLLCLVFFFLILFVTMSVGVMQMCLQFKEHYHFLPKKVTTFYSVLRTVPRFA